MLGRRHGSQGEFKSDVKPLAETIVIDLSLEAERLVDFQPPLRIPGNEQAIDPLSRAPNNSKASKIRTYRLHETD